MQILIQAKDQVLTSRLREQVDRGLRYSLTRYEPEIRRLEVDIDSFRSHEKNGNPRVKIRVRLRSLPDVVVEDIEPQLGAAIDRAIDRAALVVKYRLFSERVRRSRVCGRV